MQRVQRSHRLLRPATAVVAGAVVLLAVPTAYADDTAPLTADVLVHDDPGCAGTPSATVSGSFSVHLVGLTGGPLAGVTVREGGDVVASAIGMLDSQGSGCVDLPAVDEGSYDVSATAGSTDATTGVVVDPPVESAPAPEPSEPPAEPDPAPPAPVPAPAEPSVEPVPSVSPDPSPTAATTLPAAPAVDPSSRPSVPAPSASGPVAPPRALAPVGPAAPAAPSAPAAPASVEPDAGAAPQPEPGTGTVLAVAPAPRAAPEADEGVPLALVLGGALLGNLLLGSLLVAAAALVASRLAARRGRG